MISYLFDTRRSILFYSIPCDTTLLLDSLVYSMLRYSLSIHALVRYYVIIAERC